MAGTEPHFLETVERKQWAETQRRKDKLLWLKRDNWILLPGVSAWAASCQKTQSPAFFTTAVFFCSFFLLTCGLMTMLGVTWIYLFLHICKVKMGEILYTTVQYNSLFTNSYFSALKEHSMRKATQCSRIFLLLITTETLIPPLQ